MKTICVTGGTGFIGGHIILQLLEKGYTVRAPLRSMGNKKRISFLMEFHKKYPGQLFLFEGADLLREGSFDEAVKGSDAVIHTAAVVKLTTDRPSSIIDPAVNGTLNVLQSCRKTKTVKCFVYTSSDAANVGPTNRDLITEEDWNEESTPQTDPYGYAKTKAEKTGWEFVEQLPQEEKFKMISINPCFVIGPQLSMDFAGTSNSVVYSVIAEFPMHPRFQYPFVDVRDVAAAHILAFEREESQGRYLLYKERWWLDDVGRFLQSKFPSLRISTRRMPSLVVYGVSLVDPRMDLAYVHRNLNVIQSNISTSKAERELGMTFRPIEESLIDSVQSFLDLGLVKPPNPNRLWFFGAGLASAVLSGYVALFRSDLLLNWFGKSLALIEGRKS